MDGDVAGLIEARMHRVVLSQPGCQAVESSSTRAALAQANSVAGIRWPVCSALTRDDSTGGEPFLASQSAPASWNRLAVCGHHRRNGDACQ